MDNNSAFKPYWASVPTDEIASEMLRKVEDFYTYMTVCGRFDLYYRSWIYYYRPRSNGARMNQNGEQNELTTVSVNHYRNLLVHLETMTTSQKPAFEARATNTDVKSMSQAILAKGLLEYYMREKHLDRVMKNAVKTALQMGEAFVTVGWDATSGKVYGQTPVGTPVYEGDLVYKNFQPQDVIRDWQLTAPEQEVFYITREWRNKYELAAKYPDLAEDILSDEPDLLKIAATTIYRFGPEDETDNIPVYTLIHKPTPAMPNGRYTQVLDNETVLLDGPLPYEHTHVYRIAPDNESGTIFGYTVGFDLLPLQENLDMLWSTVSANQSAFGVQNVLVPKGSDISTSAITGALNEIQYDSKLGEPKPLALVATAPEIFGQMDRVERTMETVSGVNSVVRGNPEASLKSGSALALVQSQAIQFSINLQQSYAALLEDTGTATIQMLQTFATVPRVAAIVGKANRPLLREFSGQDLSNISRVLVDMGNPLTNTTAGRVNLADNLQANGHIADPDQYIMVLQTGRYENLVQGKQAELLLIKAENEKLQDGIPQRAVVTDQHLQHINEHKVILASPEARANPNSPQVVATLSHIQEHIQLLSDPANATLLTLLNQQPLQMAPAPAETGLGDAMSPQNPAVATAENIQPPNMPKPPANTAPETAQMIDEQMATLPRPA